MRQKRINKNFGFTLLELLVAMAIIAILSTAIWGNFFTSLTKSRDSKRKQDLDLISKALDLYYTDMKSYPASFPSLGTALINPTNPAVIYMQKIPNDPLAPTAPYCYPTVAGGSYYKMYAQLENPLDAKIIPTVTCNGVYYNYGISSSNTTP